jgi:NAD(P)H dehydrogenase (quinone)
MATISIVYFSGSGTTALLADAIAAGAQSVAGTEVQLFRITGSQIKDGRWQDEEVLKKLSASDAIIFGTPTYMGSVAAQFKAFADATGGIWYTRGWRNKLAGGFTTSGSPSGDKQSTLLYLSVFAAQHGMTWVGSEPLPAVATGDATGVNRLGSFLGVMGQGVGPHEGPAKLGDGDALTGELYGKRIAELAQRTALAPAAAA